MIVPEFHNLLNGKKIYSYNELPEIFAVVRKHFRFAYSNRKHKYFDVPAAFDIETTSFIDEHGQKAATMYEWTFGIYGLVIIGRTWEEFTYLIKDLVKILQLAINKRVCIYVHNLAYEFQFIRKLFTWDKVFAIDSRKPAYALTTDGVEFRCSYILSGYSLEIVGKKLQRYKINKLVGSLDYSKPRHSKTPLTKKEKDYCVNDVKVVMAYIAERIIEDGNIAKIPLTKTGYVRTFCRNHCFYEEDKPRKKSLKRLRYREIMQALTLDVEEYDQLKRAFQGGYTHANALFTQSIMEDVTSYDFTSSYPTVMIADKFPMSKGEVIALKDTEDFKKNISLYCCLFDVQFIGLKSKFAADDYISLSRCWNRKKPIVNNGRVHSADMIQTTITETDFLIIQKAYTWDKMYINNFRRYKKDYLPTDFVKSILKLYADKTTLKGVAGREVEYLNGKENLNASYGMSVTDVCRPEIEYNGEWLPEKPPNKAEQITKYNNSGGRFLFYPWGVWVTAYARRNLWTGIFEFGDDYIYSDTDSIKVINEEKHLEYLNNYNEAIRKDLITAMEYHGIDPEAIEPKTIKGVKKCLGVWDFDGNYKRFKTLGAKRYMTEYSNDKRNDAEDFGKISITVAGLNKRVCVPYLKKKYGEKIFENFSNHLHIPAEYTGKLTHTYIDEERNGVLTDYKGVEGEYSEKSCVHLAPADYSLSMAEEYTDFIVDLQGGLL